MFNVGFDPFRPWLRFQPPPDEAPGFRVGLPAEGPGLLDLQPARADEEPPAGALPAEVTPRAWWEQARNSNDADGGGFEPHWPWLRAPTDDVPGFRLNTDGSLRADEQGNNVQLMSGALSPLESQEPPDEVASDNVVTSLDVVPSPSTGAPPSPGMATSIALPAAGGVAGDLTALAERVVPKIAALGGRVGTAAAGAAGAAVGALPLMLIPATVGSQTTDLGNGLRARVRTGQRTVEIEQRVDNGVLGTGLGATWKALPVDANMVVGRDGRPNIVVNHEQLNRALGRTAPAESNDAGISAMARPPKDGIPEQLPPTVTDPTVNNAEKPDTGVPPATQSAAISKIDAKALEEAKQPDPEEERLLACRAVRAMPGQPAPPGQYDGRGGIETAVGIRVPPGYPVPKGGYDYSPDYLRHRNGYRGELELKNRIEKAVPYEKFVHYGNPAGDQGPDVLTIGPDNRFMEWDSRSRMAKRRLGPSMASAASLKPDDVAIYVWNAIRSRAVPPDAGAKAVQELEGGNYNICTVGTGNAYDGYFESVRNGVPTGPRR